jgi:hypothetical protein
MSQNTKNKTLNYKIKNQQYTLYKVRGPKLYLITVLQVSAQLAHYRGASSSWTEMYSAMIKDKKGYFPIFLVFL